MKNLKFSIIFRKHRLHFSRLLAPLRFCKELYRYRPDLVIITTYELIPMAVVAKRFLSFKLVYDIQENYAKNVLLHNTLPIGIRQLLSQGIKTIEKLGLHFIDHCFFAETCYVNEFPHIRQYTILENKFQGKIQDRMVKPVLPENPLQFAMTGTITPVYGILPAILWFEALHQIRPHYRLKIIGHVPIKSFFHQLKRDYGHLPFLELVIAQQAIPYREIQEAIRKADILLMPYELNSAIRDKIPTKLYEGIALQKPVLISKNPVWQKIIAGYPAGMEVDFSDKEMAYQSILQLSKTVLYQKLPGKEVHWSGEEEKLLTILSKLLSSFF